MPPTTQPTPGIRTAFAAACAALALTACGSRTTATDEPDPQDRQEETVTPQPRPSSSPAPSGPAGRAAADLAERLGVDAAEVSVESVEEVTWNDGSMGCAEKDMMYTQALVDGSRITLRAGEQTYEYHSGGARAPFLCENPTQ